MVSIIIPVYNTGQILNKCLKSLVSQTYGDWECILVDDCSIDRKTIAVLENWEKKDKRFRLIINEKNQGIEKNRFVGLAQVRGEFVMFMDHDDWLYDKYSLEHLVSNAYTTQADVVIGHHNHAYGLINRPSALPIPSGVIRQPELKEKYYCSYFGVNIMPVYIWARIYRKDLIDRANMEPHGLLYADDVAWNLFIMPYADKVSIIDDIVYVHRWGGTSSRFADGLKEEKHFYYLRIDALKKFDFPEGKKWLDIEAKNVLKVDFQQRMQFFMMNRQELYDYIKSELEDPIWEMIEPTIRNCCNDEFSRAFLDKDIPKLCSLTKAVVNSPQTRLKRCIKSFLRVINTVSV